MSIDHRAHCTMSIDHKVPVNQQISGLTVTEGGKLFAGYNNTINNIHHGIRKPLPYAIEAEFNAFGKDEDNCLPNTRVDILEQIRAWVDGDEGPNIFWLSGWAGTGKSIIARTISRQYYDKGRLGENFFASFFFSRGLDEVSNAGKFVTSIAIQLARSPVLRERIDEATLSDDGIANRILHDQWKQLIIEPLSKLDPNSVHTKLVLVVDALDECDKRDDIQRVIQLLANAGALQTVQLRVLITSRPEKNIRHCFSYILRGVYREFILHDLSRFVVDNDIFVFLKHNFHRIFTDWPGEQAIERLVQKSSGLFIWAATAYRFIHEGSRFAERRLLLLLQGNANITKPEDELDKIYMTVLKNSIGDNYDEQEKEISYNMLREILGSIVLLFSQLSADSLVSLINCSREDLEQTLEHLHSILDVPEEQACPIRVHHPSFRDFFLDTKRCTDRHLQVDRNEAHGALANSCIRIMSEMLKKDICNLILPGTLRDEVDDQKIEQFLPVSLQYACSYWVQHFQESKSPLLDDKEVHLFLRKNLLFWLEALCLLRKSSEGIVALISLENLADVDQSPGLYEFIHDAKRFALANRKIIEDAPLQIYCSALLFAPEMSLVRKEFKSQMPDWITRVSKGHKYWGPALQTLEGHSDWVLAVVFAPDGKLIASASRDYTVRLWDASTGGALHTLEGHSESVEAIVFSPDGKLLASGSSDNTVILWDSFNGAVLQILEGHLDSVISVAFSPDGKLVASASGDCTVLLWDANTGTVLQSLERHLGSVRAVVFSSYGKLVASASEDKIVRLWDPYTGAALQSLAGHSSSVNDVVFSPDGKLVASASDDGTVWLWDASTGRALHILEGHLSRVMTVVFSPDGKLIASASYDSTVGLWDSSTGAALQTLQGHSGSVTTAVFSPDSKLLASGSTDKTVMLWDPFTGAVLQTLKGHSREVITVVFSPNGKLIASASDDCTVLLWDSSLGAAPQSLEGHSDWVLDVVFSPDGKFVASASIDGTIRLWDSSTGTALQELEGHFDSVLAVVFSPDGKLIASASDDCTVWLWDSSTGEALQSLEGHSNSVRDVVFSPDGKLVASASDDSTVRLWDSSTGAGLQTMEGHSTSVGAVVFSPEGNLIASASEDSTVRLWGLSTGLALQTLEGHLGWVTAVAFSSDGNLLASASEDCTVRLWDFSTGAALQALEIEKPINRLSFSQDGLILETDRGLFSFRSVSTDSHSQYQPVTVSVILDGRWIAGAVGRLLCLPPAYDLVCSAVRNNTVVVGNSSGLVTFVNFDLSRLPPITPMSWTIHPMVNSLNDLCTG